jgi:hypothetical protein
MMGSRENPLMDSERRTRLQLFPSLVELGKPGQSLVLDSDYMMKRRTGGRSLPASQNAVSIDTVPRLKIH